MYQATVAIEKAFVDHGLRCAAKETASLSFVELNMTGDNTSVLIRFISTDNNNDVKVMTADFAKFPQKKLADGYELANELSREYKYMKFTIDNDGDMCAQYDFPVQISNECLGPVALEILMRCAKIIDDCYPKVMKTLWG